jgi:hypothetical protein
MGMKPAFLVLSAFLFLSCAGVPEKPAPAADPETVDIQKKLVQSAEDLVGKKRLSFGNTNFSYDCTGTVLAAYFLSGRDLRNEFAKYQGNGVARLYRMAENNKVLSAGHDPLPGDVVFWDNTYDKNGDGKLNDELTHTGLVIRADPDGRIDYVHHHIRRGIVVESMNLKKPDIYGAFNAPMRVREPGPRPEKWLAGQLYRSYGRLWAIKNHG